MAHEFTSRRLVEFADTDMAGILHFSNYFRYMEATEHAFFRSLGMSVHTGDPGLGSWGWARGQAQCTYTAPLMYEDVVELRLSVRGKRSKSLTYEVVFYKVHCGKSREDITPIEVARGSMMCVCVEKNPEGGIRSKQMPAEVDQQIQVAP